METLVDKIWGDYLDANQNVNNGKSLHGRFYITTEQLSTYELAKINAIESELVVLFAFSVAVAVVLPFKLSIPSAKFSKLA